MNWKQRGLHAEAWSRAKAAPARSGVRSPKWHIVSAHDAIAAEHLKDQHEVYFPKLRVMKKVPRKMLSAKQRASDTIIKRARLEVFLPGYMFVHFDYDVDSWSGIFEIPGVHGMICNDDHRPRQLPDSMIDGWMATEFDGAIPGDAKINSLFPFDHGINEGDSDRPIEELDAVKRVRLFADIFCRKSPVGLA